MEYILGPASFKAYLQNPPTELSLVNIFRMWFFVKELEYCVCDYAKWILLRD